MRSIVLACVLGGSAGAAACLLKLDNEIACGDGYTDTPSGEECDPEDSDSYRDACGTVPGYCNPNSCQLECCGDEVANGVEECDASDLGQLGPDGGSGAGEGCRGLTIPGTTQRYAGGTLGCTDACRFDLSGCSLCGNEQIDPRIVYPDAEELGAEICDGDFVLPEPLRSRCAGVCEYAGDKPVECNVACDGCRFLTVLEPKQCCRPKDTPIDLDRERGYPCCCELDERECDLTELAPEPGVQPVCPG
ncbi:MAG: hypothetical protein AAGF11_08815 [Myxococcota bacterium]